MNQRVFVVSESGADEAKIDEEDSESEEDPESEQRELDSGLSEPETDGKLEEIGSDQDASDQDGANEGKEVQIKCTPSLLRLS